MTALNLARPLTIGLPAVWPDLVKVRDGERQQCFLPVLRAHLDAENFGPNRTCYLRVVLPAAELEGAQRAILRVRRRKEGHKGTMSPGHSLAGD